MAEPRGTGSIEGTWLVSSLHLFPHVAAPLDHGRSRSENQYAIAVLEMTWLSGIADAPQAGVPCDVHRNRYSGTAERQACFSATIVLRCQKTTPTFRLGALQGNR